MPEPTVLATAVPKTKAATKLKNAAQITAWTGDSTRVETTVAMELAASWNPLMKSKMSATAMISSRMAKRGRHRLAVLDDDAFDHVRDVLAGVGHLLEHVEQVLSAS